MEVPETLYAESEDGLNLAYQVFGDGPTTVLVSPLLSNVELAWEHELYRRVLEHMGKHLRIVHFDKRGIGCSDRFEHHPSLDQRIGDISAVMDAVGVERAHLFGLSEGGLMSQLFALRHPARVDRMVLANSAVGVGPPGLYSQTEARDILRYFDDLIDSWGRRPEVMVERFMPSQRHNESFVRWVGRLQRLSANPADMRRQIESVLALPAPEDVHAIEAPTLVMYSEGDQVITRACAEHLVANIPGAELSLLPVADHFLWVDATWRGFTDELISFLTQRPVERRSERQFATVLFTDLVDSTAQSARAGDAAWHEMLDGHDRVCRRVIDEFSGTLVKSTGDGILATFSGPSDGVSAAVAIRRDLAGIGLTIRAGLHAGEIESHADGDVSGLAVNLAARVEAAATAGSVFTSSTVRELLLGGSREFADRGEHSMKGIDGAWRLYEVTA